MRHGVTAFGSSQRPPVTALLRGPLYPKSRYVFCLIHRPMQTEGGSTTSLAAPSSDIVFACSHCSTSLVVDAAAAGMTLNCQACGKPTTVPKMSAEAAAENAARISDLQHQLKENESQR